jgi:hypothetical protein
MTIFPLSFIFQKVMLKFWEMVLMICLDAPGKILLEIVR